MTNNSDSLKALLAAKMGDDSASTDTPCTPVCNPSRSGTLASPSDELEELREKLHTFAGDLLDSMRAEGELQEEVNALKEEVNALKSELALARKRESEQYWQKWARGKDLSWIFLELLPRLEGSGVSLADAKLYAELRAGTEDATVRIAQALEQVATAWLEEVAETRDYLATWPPKELEVRDAQIAKVKKHPQVLSSLSRHEISYWHEVRPYREAFIQHQADATLAGEVAWKTVSLAKATVQKDAPPMILAFAFESAYKAKEAFDSLYRSLRDDVALELERAVVSAEGYVDHVLANTNRSRTRASTTPSTDGSGEYAPSGAYSTSSRGFTPSDTEFPSHTPDTEFLNGPAVSTSDWEPVDPYPAFNPASGLPMTGGGSPFDMGGNVFGTNNDFP
jgi:hypothetical protein